MQTPHIQPGTYPGKELPCFFHIIFLCLGTYYTTAPSGTFNRDLTW